MAATMDFTLRSGSTRLLLEARTPRRTESDVSTTVDSALPGGLSHLSTMSHLPVPFALLSSGNRARPASAWSR